MDLRGLKLAVVLLAMASPSWACYRTPSSGHYIPQSGIDQAVLSRAILKEVNYVRCRKGLPSLALAPRKLTHVAEGHSAWMAANGQMSHQGGRQTGRTLTDRVRRAGLSPRTYAENLAYLPRFQFGGRHFRVSDRATCSFTTMDGRSVSAHSYESLARTVVAMWMDSPGHRRNLLSKSQREMVAAARVMPDDYCGRFYVTQIFTG